MLPTPHTATRFVFQEGATNDYGDPIELWSTVGTSHLVHGWAPPSADQMPFEQNRSAVVRDLDLLAPVGTPSAPRDHWDVGGVLYEQVGHAEDFSTGPFGFSSGLRINLKRVEG